MNRNAMAVAMIAVVLGGCATTNKPVATSFFVTSTGTGKGADFGGLDGADKHCAALAAAAGLPNQTWRAYLSNSASGSTPAVNAKDRIGTGPWTNVKGDVIANNVAHLHSNNNNLTKQTALTEKGAVTNGRGDTPNQHDILTGSKPDGTAFPASDGDTTFGNWTKSGEGSAVVGHHDRMGLPNVSPVEATSWNSSHASRGCSDEALRGTGGAGLLYCFAAK
jgi:hypothetical protein